MTYLDELSKIIHQANKNKGFWPESEERNFGEALALIHSEISEALEEHRSSNPPLWFNDVNGKCVLSALNDGKLLSSQVAPNEDGLIYCKDGDHGPLKLEGGAVELVDALIRILDTLQGFYPYLSIDTMLQWKLFYNESREPKHGKAY